MTVSRGGNGHNHLTFTEYEWQVIKQISQSGDVPDEVWFDFINTLNQEQKWQLGL